MVLYRWLPATLWTSQLWSVYPWLPLTCWEMSLLPYRAAAQEGCERGPLKAAVVWISQQHERDTLCRELPLYYGERWAYMVSLINLDLVTAVWSLKRRRSAMERRRQGNVIRRTGKMYHQLCLRFMWVEFDWFLCLCQSLLCSIGTGSDWLLPFGLAKNLALQ